MSTICRNRRHSMNVFNASTNTNVCPSEMQTDTLGGNDVECMKATNLKSEEGESYDKFHKSKIPIRIKDRPHENTSIFEKGHEDIIRRLELVERALLSNIESSK